LFHCELGEGRISCLACAAQGRGLLFLVLTAVLAAARRAGGAQRGMTEGGGLGPTNDPGWVHRSG
jgi:hypothetical protein